MCRHWFPNRMLENCSAEIDSLDCKEAVLGVFMEYLRVSFIADGCYSA